MMKTRIIILSSLSRDCYSNSFNDKNQFFISETSDYNVALKYLDSRHPDFVIIDEGLLSFWDLSRFKNILKKFSSVNFIFINRSNKSNLLIKLINSSKQLFIFTMGQSESIIDNFIQENMKNKKSKDSEIARLKEELYSLYHVLSVDLSA